jgi:hypothetical protein
MGAGNQASSSREFCGSREPTHSQSARMSGAPALSPAPGILLLIWSHYEQPYLMGYRRCSIVLGSNHCDFCRTTFEHECGGREPCRSAGFLTLLGASTIGTSPR